MYSESEREIARSVSSPAVVFVFRPLIRLLLPSDRSSNYWRRRGRSSEFAVGNCVVRELDTVADGGGGFSRLRQGPSGEVNLMRKLRGCLISKAIKFTIGPENDYGMVGIRIL